MPLIYFISSSTNARTYSKRISLHCESFLESECIVPEEGLSLQETRTHIEECDVLIVVVSKSPITSSFSTYNLIDNERLRSEIILAMNRDTLIVPILINDAKLPKRSNAPGALKKLIDCKSYCLRTVFWSEDMELFLEYLEEELEFIKEVKNKLIQSVEVNYQRLADFDGRRQQSRKLELESSNGMELQKVVEAETIFLQKARAASDIIAEKNALSALGLVYARLGQTLKAIKYFLEQLEVARDLGNAEELCSILASLGDAYAISGNIGKAYRFYQEQRVLAESKNLPAYVGSSYNGLGYVCVQQKETEKAIENYLKALLSYRELEDHEKQLELLVGIGLNWRKLEQWGNSIDCLNQALDIAKYLENRKEEVQILLDLAETYFEQNKRDIAIHQLNKVEEAIKINGKTLPASLIRRVNLLRKHL
jgi:tetratricopeptide (TPR) repeat protein